MEVGGIWCDNIEQSLIWTFLIIVIVRKIYYWWATTIAPIKAAKRIIEMSSNGRKKSIDKWTPICWLLLIKSCSIIWFDSSLSSNQDSNQFFGVGGDWN